MDLALGGKTVMITGASKGIGKAAAHAFAREGCHLRLVARSRELLTELGAHITATYRTDVTIHVADLRNREHLALIGAVARDVDVLVNNAGDIPAGDLEAIEEE